MYVYLLDYHITNKTEKFGLETDGSLVYKTFDFAIKGVENVIDQKIDDVETKWLDEVTFLIKKDEDNWFLISQYEVIELE